MPLNSRRALHRLAAAVLVALVPSTSALAQTAPGSGEPKFPSSKISGLMFGDYYWFSQSHRDQVSDADPTPIRELQGEGRLDSALRWR